ncbi:hypothetical protein ACEWY4_001540 [Coilia grayii]|uniref:DUF4371 domain-containing protein n=1 Tax=Coilia grayii TaxID=363190 RepID=A0ABD1KTA0_9TELE
MSKRPLKQMSLFQTFTKKSKSNDPGPGLLDPGVSSACQSSPVVADINEAASNDRPPAPSSSNALQLDSSLVPAEFECPRPTSSEFDVRSPTSPPCPLTSETDDGSLSSTLLTNEPSASSANEPRVSPLSDLSDIGKLQPDALKCAPDSVKLIVLQNRFRPDRGWKPPSTLIFGKLRKVPDESKYPTLRYSVCQDSLFCVACMLFSSGDLILRTKPLRDWSNAKKIVAKHIATQAHQNAQLRASEFLQICTGKKLSICSSLDRSHQETTERNRHSIQAIIDLVSTCGQQNVALRGHTDGRSNFQAFLKYRAKGDTTLKQYLQLAPANTNFCGHQIQNEIIELCGNQIQNAILRKCRSAEWFSVILDETADVSNTEQVSILVRYVHNESGGFSVREDFLCFVSTADTTGETLTKVLLDKLTELKLDPKNMVGQGYDGAGNVSGKVRGVQT